jgi:hypothetical protein
MRAVLWYTGRVVVISSSAVDSAYALNQLLD